MATHLALNLTHDAIDLLHDTGAGWVVLGSARLDAPDFARKLAGLRATAAQVGGLEYHTLLLIPASEILYTSASPTGLGPDADAERVRDTLDGATPYAVSDLVFDWFEQDERLRIAVVARETLAEAESFAEEHGFRPVGFSAIAPDNGFARAPWFGATARAAELLPGGADRPARIVLAGALSPEDLAALIAERAPKPEPAPAPLDTAETADTDAPAEATDPHPQDVAEDAPPAPETAAEAPAPEGEALPAFSSRRGGAKSPEQKQTRQRKRKAAQQKAKAPAPEDAASAPVIPPEAPPEDAPEPAPAFSSIRARKAPAEDDAPPAAAEAPDLPPPPQVPDPSGPLPPARSAAPTAPPEAADLEGAARSLSARREDAATAAAAKPAAKAKALRSMFAGRASRPKAPVKPEVAEAEALTVFGARPGQQTTGADPGRGGLVVTGGMILVLLAIGIWAGIAYREQVEAWLYGTPPLPEEIAILPPRMVTEPAVPPIGAVPQPDLAEQTAALPEPVTPPVTAAPAPARPETDPPDATAPEVLPEAPPLAGTLAPRPAPELAPATVTARPLPRVNALPALPPSRSAPAAPLDTALIEDDILLDDAEPEIVVLTPEETRAEYAATGIWQSAPEQPQSGLESEIERLYLAAIDPVVLGADAIDLPRDPRRLRDAALPRQANPPRPGVDILLGADGLVTPTPGGTLNPDGVLVYAGQPPINPPRRPGLSDPPVATPPDALAELRPRSRPGGLAEDAERLRFGGRTRAELGALRPLERPASLEELAAALRAEEATLAAIEADALAAKQRAEAEAASRAGASPLAVTASLTPRARPSGPAPVVASTSSGADDDTDTADEPALQPSQRVTPSEATPVSVARQATESGLRLNRMNLIGVFGTPNDRRALVRLPSGRLLRLKVGDRLDGGRVATIDDDALRYNKGGREFTLEMPRG